jgi:hypothetical protein
MSKKVQHAGISPLRGLNETTAASVLLSPWLKSS